MNKFITLIVGLLLINLIAKGQDNVQIFQGRKLPFMSQKILDLSFQNLNQVPTLPNSQEIEILILDNNKIEHIPSWIGNLKNLRILSIRNNNLLDLNPKLSFCENLEQLYLCGNKKLSELPSLSFCEKLEIIDVIGTQINEVPAWVSLMDNLYYFKFTEKK